MIRSLAITGPTASGKTAISIALAKKFGCEIISCDSMQIYRDMDIGTAKVTKAEAEGIPHHLIDIVEPTDSFSVEDYRALALKAAGEIDLRGNIPMLVGGTGLYVDSLMRAPMTGVPESSIQYRDKILAEIKGEDDIERLWQRLREVDPESAEAIHKNNVRRVIRALEIYELTGRTKSEIDRESKKASPDIKIDMITLDFHDRETLYRRIDMRVDMMIQDGLIDEVRSLYDAGLLVPGTTAYQAIGYKELIAYIRGERPLADCAEEIKLASRRYAKRQLTWFRHEESATTLYMDREDGKMRDIDDVISEASLFVNRKLNEEK